MTANSLQWESKAKKQFEDCDVGKLETNDRGKARTCDLLRVKQT